MLIESTSPDTALSTTEDADKHWLIASLFALKKFLREEMEYGPDSEILSRDGTTIKGQDGPAQVPDTNPRIVSR